MKHACLVSLCVVLCSTAQAAALEAPPATSLFFSVEESKHIDSLMEQMKPKPGTLHGIHLGAVMVYSPDRWTIWLQGERWSPETSHPNLQVVSVEPNEVHLNWRQSGASPPRDIFLRPYQTYLPSSGKIIEGLR